MPAPVKLYLASSNRGKLHEYQMLASGATPRQVVELEMLPNLDSLPRFEESAPTFAENAARKALHHSRFVDAPVIADDSGLVVAGLGGAPGVASARHAGPKASDAERVEKLLKELRRRRVTDRRARFVCVVALAERGAVRGVFSDFVAGEILEKPRGSQGFGYDPVFFFPPLRKTFAEIPSAEKNEYSHRGKAFRRLLAFLEGAEPA